MQDKLDNKLKVYRAMHDLTQAKLAERVGVTRKTINTVERGVFVPSTILSLKIARVFGVTVEDVFQLAGDVEVSTDLHAGTYRLPATDQLAGTSIEFK